MQRGHVRERTVVLDAVGGDADSVAPAVRVTVHVRVGGEALGVGVRDGAHDVEAVGSQDGLGVHDRLDG